MEIGKYTQKVRPYTPAERAAVTPGEAETPADRLERRRATQTADENRYVDALYRYPELGSHFERLAVIGHHSLANTAVLIGVDPQTERMGDFEVRPTVPFDGTESPVTGFRSREVNLARYHLPA